jgi:hypothetical protein
MRSNLNLTGTAFEAMEFFLLYKQETLFQVLRHISAHYWDSDMLMKLVSVGLKIANYCEFSDEEQFEPHWYSLRGHGKTFFYKQETLFQVMRHISAHYWDSDMLMKLVSVGLKIADYREFSDEEQFEVWTTLKQPLSLYQSVSVCISDLGRPEGG